jgi:hypothetical protein
VSMDFAALRGSAFNMLGPLMVSAMLLPLRALRFAWR